MRVRLKEQNILAVCLAYLWDWKIKIWNKNDWWCLLFTYWNKRRMRMKHIKSIYFSIQKWELDFYRVWELIIINIIINNNIFK